MELFNVKLFIIPMTLQPKVVDLQYLLLRILLVQILKVYAPSGCKDLGIRVFGKNSAPCYQ